MSLLLLLGCTPEPASFADCEALVSPDLRTVCRVVQLDDVAWDRELLIRQADSIQDPLERDMLLVELAVGDPRNQGWICKQVRHDYGAKKCEQVLGRPHLATPPKEERGPNRGKPPVTQPGPQSGTQP